MLLAVGLSLLITISLYFIFSSSISLPEILGIMFGAVTSTPGLGATQEALQSLGSKQDITVGYACAYPFAILSVIGVILGLKKLFEVNLARRTNTGRKLSRLRTELRFTITLKQQIKRFKALP